MIDFNIFTILSTARVYTISCLYMLVTFITITFFFFSSAVIVIQFWTLSRYSCTAYVLYILDLASTNFYFSEPTEHSVSFYIVCLLVRIKKKFWKFRKKLYGKFRTIDWFIISNKSHRKLKWFHEIFFRFFTLKKKKKNSSKWWFFTKWRCYEKPLREQIFDDWVGSGLRRTEIQISLICVMFLSLGIFKQFVLKISSR